MVAKIYYHFCPNEKNHCPGTKASLNKPSMASATSAYCLPLWENKGLSKLSTHLLVYTSGKTRCVYLIEKKSFLFFPPKLG